MKRINQTSNQWFRAAHFTNGRAYTAIISLTSYSNISPTIIAVNGYINGTSKSLQFNLLSGNADLISQVKYKIVEGSSGRRMEANTDTS